MLTGKELISLLEAATREPRRVGELAVRFHRLWWDTPDTDIALSESEEEILGDLAYDLEYFKPDAAERSQATWYFGPERALQEIHAALVKLGRQVPCDREERR